MADALPNAGTTTDPGEFRRLLARLFSPGVVNGLTLTAGTGLAVTVAPGNAAAGDANSITFLPYPAAVSLTALAPNAVTTVYATYRTTGDLQAYLTTAVPATPYEVVGTATTNATAVTSVDNSTAPATTAGRRHQSEYPAVVGRYFSTQAKIDASSFGLAVAGVLDATPGRAVNAPLGVRLGATTAPMARYYVRTYRNATQSIPNNAWTPVGFNVDSVIRNDYATIDPASYPTPPHNAGGDVTAQRRFYAGPAGTYTFSGRITFDSPAGAVAGDRRGRIIRYNSAGVAVWIIGTDSHSAVDTQRVAYDATIDMQRGDWVEFEALHTQGAALTVSSNEFAGAAPTPVYATMTLVQVA